MWRNYLLGKMSVVTLASLIIGAVCISHPWRIPGPLSDSVGWLATGAFFLLLAVGMLVTIVVLFRKPK
jgi:hypothetical protein